jgi:hypothetical protein
MIRKRIVLWAAASLGGWLLASGCHKDGVDPGLAGQVGSAQAAVTKVPTDGSVACITITAASSSTITRSFDVTPGESTVFTLLGIPIGTVIFQGAAYATACNQVTASSVPTWESPPVPATVEPGEVTLVTLEMTEVGGGTAAVDFDGGAQCRAQGLPCLTAQECCSGLYCAADDTCQPPVPSWGATALVCGGAMSSTASYVVVGALGQAPGGNAASAGTKYVLQGGIVGATQGAQ